jgi:DNA-binding response OmpR family regulator
MKVLVVDDDPEQRELRCLLLEHNGFSTFAAGDQNDAHRLACQHTPEAAIIDLGIPSVADGLALIRDLKKLNPRISILVLTGLPRKTIEHELIPLGIDGLFVKPTPTAEIVARLRSQLDARSSSAPERVQ